MNKTLLLAAMIMLSFSCKPTTEREKDGAEEGVLGLDLTMMDTTVRPQDDFYRYANGGWLDNTELPGDQSKWGAFNELAKATDQKVLQALEEAIADGQIGADTDQGKAVLFYQVAMDTAHINELGLQPIQGELEKITAIQSIDELRSYLVAAAPLGLQALVSLSVRPDLNNSDINAVFLGGGSLGLPGKEYYTQEDEETLRIQKEYKAFASRVLQLLGRSEEDAQTEVEQIFSVEQRLADAKLDKIQRRNPLLMNNPRSQAEIAAMTPSFDWPAYLKDIGIGMVDTLIVMEPKYMEALETTLTQTPLEDLKAYTHWTLVNSALAYASAEFERTNFDFYQGVLNGTTEMKPRRERVIQIVNYTMGEALGKLYVDTHFPPAAKGAAEQLVGNLKEGFRSRILKLDWMSDSTKTKALEKLDALVVKIGYPDKWKDYGDLKVLGAEKGGSYIGNLLNVSRWAWAEDMAKVGQPVDKTEWFMPPQMVNAYYHPLYNEIVFPAAILQPPYYNYKADPAVNYGGIGAVIGHEISHAFDDQGSRYDAKGNLSNWWTEEDQERFEVLTGKLVKQFDQYEPLPGVNVNGAFTLGENIGDLGGVNVAYDALQRHLQEHGDPGLIDGLTQEQRFFVNWATVWRSLYTDDAMRQQIKTNVHSPGKYRAIGPLANIPAFYQAFDIQPSDGMYVADSLRITIW